MFYNQGYAGNSAARRYAAVHSGSRTEGATPHGLVKILFDELLLALDDSVAKAKEIVGGFDDTAMMESWSVAAGDKTLMSMPRLGWLRAVMLNHWYHHRGQLSVYLRLLDVPVPSLYGPSADENPFD